jgi:hypothetical protein
MDWWARCCFSYSPEATGQPEFDPRLRCKSATLTSGDLAGAIAVQLGAIHKKRAADEAAPIYLAFGAGVIPVSCVITVTFAITVTSA